MEARLPKSIRQLRLRPARVTDMPWLIARFPWASRMPSSVDFMVAESVEGSVVGGCCYFIQLSPDVEPAAMVEFQIAEEFQVKPISSAFLQFLRRRAWADGISTLTHRAVWEGSGLEQLFRAHNFQSVSSVTSFEVDVAKVWNDFDRTYQLLQKRGKISDAARIVSLKEAPFVSVTELVRDTIGGDALKMEMQFGAGQYSEQYSQVVQIGPIVAAAILVRVENNMPEVSYMAIDRKWRNSWIYVGLVRELMRKLMADGYVTCRYKTNPGNNLVPTNSGKRLEGKILGREILYRLA